MVAIFVGRFQPFHKGHLEAIKWILKREKKILIFIGSLQEFWQRKNPFTFFERKEMIESSLFDEKIKNFKIYGVPDFFDDVFWAKKVLEIAKLRKKEVKVFTQNLWTKRCFEKIGVKVLPHPIFFNSLSATQIRERIFERKSFKEFVPKKVFSFLSKKEIKERLKFLSVLPEERIVRFIKEKVKEAKAKGALVGLSGGLDSSLLAVLAKKALGKRAFFLNINFSNFDSNQKNISLLEKQFKIKVKKFNFSKIYQKFLKALPKGDKLSRGNLKPRLRMSIFYYFANLKNLLVLGSSNKSELEIGYFTKFGDSGADIFPLGDLFKTEIIEMAKRLSLPEKIIKTKPSANLWPGQSDEKELGLDYQKIDTILKLVKQGFKEKEISFFSGIKREKIKETLERKRKNLHKLAFPPICKLKFD